MPKKQDDLGTTLEELETYLQRGPENAVELLYKLKEAYQEEVRLYQIHMKKVRDQGNRKMQATIDDRFARRLGLLMSIHDLEQLLFDRYDHELGVNWELKDADYISPWH